MGACVLGRETEAVVRLRRAAKPRGESDEEREMKREMERERGRER